MSEKEIMSLIAFIGVVISGLVALIVSWYQSKRSLDLLRLEMKHKYNE